MNPEVPEGPLWAAICSGCTETFVELSAPSPPSSSHSASSVSSVNQVKTGPCQSQQDRGVQSEEQHRHRKQNPRDFPVTKAKSRN